MTEPSGAGPEDRSPSRPRAILDLCRVSNLPTVWMNVLAAGALSGANPGFGVLLLLIFAFSSLYCFGMALNDLCDRDFDAAHQPFRPIPSGRISIAEARVAAAVLCLAGMASLHAAPHPEAALAGLGLVACIALYDRFHKAHPASVFLMAGCRAMVFLATGLAVAGDVAPAVFAGAAVCFVYTLGITVVARHEGQRGRPYPVPMVPLMIAGMPVADSILPAVWSHPSWLVAGGAAALLTHFGQRFVRGD